MALTPTMTTYKGLDLPIEVPPVAWRIQSNQLDFDIDAVQKSLIKWLNDYTKAEILTLITEIRTRLQADFAADTFVLAAQAMLASTTTEYTADTIDKKGVAGMILAVLLSIKVVKDINVTISWA